MKNSRLLDFLSGYKKYVFKKEARKKREFRTKQFSGVMTQKKKSFLSKRFFKAARKFSNAVSHLSSRFYGSLGLSFGLTTLLIYFLKLSKGGLTSTPIIGAAVALLSIPFMLIDKPLPLSLQDFALTDYVFFEFFGIKRLNKTETKCKFPTVFAYLIGIAAGAIGLVVPTWQISVAVFAIVFVYLTMLAPEFAFFVSLLAMPYTHFIPHATAIFAVLIVLSAVSFLRKAYFGKRVLYLESYDVCIALMMLAVLISGVFVKGFSSFAWSVEMIFLAFGYTLASNIVTNRRLADRAVNSIVISSVPPALIAMGAFVSRLIEGDAAAYIDKGIYFAFSNGSAAAVLMMAASVFSLAMLRQNKGAKRAFYILTLTIDSIGLLLTGELYAVIALILGIGAYFLLKMNKWSSILLFVLVVLPYLSLLLPAWALDKVFSVIPSLESAGELFKTWRAAIAVFEKNLFFGIGMGADSFSEEMASVGVNGSNSSNLFIEIGLEAGIFALVFFVSLLFIRLLQRADYYRFIKHSEVSAIAPMCSVCVFCLVAYGAVNYIWSDVFTYYLFWCVFGIGSATLRSAKREYDDRVHYYDDTRALDSSSIDIGFK